MIRTVPDGLPPGTVPIYKNLAPKGISCYTENDNKFKEENVMKMKKILALLLTVFLLTGLLAGCSASTNGASSDMMYMEMESAVEDKGLYGSTTDSAAGSTALQDSRKLIKTVDLDAETKDLGRLLLWLNEKVAALGGYVEQRDIYNGSSYNSSRSRSANMTVRIPADQADAFVEEMGEYSNIISTNETVEDVTLNYVATESRVKALQTEEARLLELMEKAETMSDLLEIEERLTDVRYELESVTSQLRTLDNQVDYATVYLYISEVRELTEPEPVGLLERIGTGFVNSLKNLGNILLELGVFLIVNLPYFAVLGIVALAVILIARKRGPRKRKTKAPYVPQEPEKE